MARSRLAAVACIGDERAGPTLQALPLGTRKRWSIALPGRPPWCVTDAEGKRVFLVIREPTMVPVAALPGLDALQRWPLRCGGAHGIDIDHRARRLYIACDNGVLDDLDTATGRATQQWPLAGAPDATFFNPASGLGHVAIEQPGLVQTIDPRSGASRSFATAVGAKTTRLSHPTGSTSSPRRRRAR